MSAWRKRALELFPDLRREFEASDATIYTVFTLLPGRCRDAHDRGDTDELTRIYGFAEWCYRQKAKNLWNAAGVSFYEHLADSRVTMREMPKWVAPDVFAEIQSLLEVRSEAALLPEVSKAYAARRTTPKLLPPDR